MTAKELKRLYTGLFDKIGGTDNQYVDHYMNRRPKTISRDVFFSKVPHAIWVAGMSAEAIQSFLKRAAKEGFDGDFRTLAAWTDRKFSAFVGRLHTKRPIPERALGKWRAIRDIAVVLSELPSEPAFRKRFFGGKAESRLLDSSDRQRLIDQHLPFIGPGNAAFIIRGIGGEAIKYDRWVLEFLRYYRLTEPQLETLLHQASIPLGLFDIALWTYCEAFVKRVAEFKSHFENDLAFA